MATLVTALNVSFTPAVGDFIIQVAGGSCDLQRQNSSGAAWVGIGTVAGGANVTNPVAGAAYRFANVRSGASTITVQADQ